MAEVGAGALALVPYAERKLVLFGRYVHSAIQLHRMRRLSDFVQQMVDSPFDLVLPWTQPRYCITVRTLHDALEESVCALSSVRESAFRLWTNGIGPLLLSEELFFRNISAPTKVWFEFVSRLVAIKQVLDGCMQTLDLGSAIQKVTPVQVSAALEQSFKLPRNISKNVTFGRVLLVIIMADMKIELMASNGTKLSPYLVRLYKQLKRIEPFSAIFEQLFHYERSLNVDIDSVLENEYPLSAKVADTFSRYCEKVVSWTLAILRFTAWAKTPRPVLAKCTCRKELEDLTARRYRAQGLRGCTRWMPSVPHQFGFVDVEFEDVCDTLTLVSLVINQWPAAVESTARAFHEKKSEIVAETCTHIGLCGLVGDTSLRRKGGYSINVQRDNIVYVSAITQEMFMSNIDFEADLYDNPFVRHGFVDNDLFSKEGSLYKMFRLYAISRCAIVRKEDMTLSSLIDSWNDKRLSWRGKIALSEWREADQKNGIPDTVRIVLTRQAILLSRDFSIFADHHWKAFCFYGFTVSMRPTCGLIVDTYVQISCTRFQSILARGRKQKYILDRWSFEHAADCPQIYIERDGLVINQFHSEPIAEVDEGAEERRPYYLKVIQQGSLPSTYEITQKPITFKESLLFKVYDTRSFKVM